MGQAVAAVNPITAGLALIGTIISANAQHHAQNDARSAASAAATGENKAVGQIQGIVNYLLGPQITQDAMNNLDVTDARQINTLMDQLSGKIMNPSALLRDFHDQTLSSGIQMIDNIRTQAPVEAANLESGIANMYGQAGAGAAQNLAALNAAPNPWLNFIGQLGGGGFNKTAGATPPVTAPGAIVPGTIASIYGPATGTAGPSTTVPAQSLLSAVGPGGYFAKNNSAGGPTSQGSGLGSLLSLLG